MDPLANRPQGVSGGSSDDFPQPVLALNVGKEMHMLTALLIPTGFDTLVLLIPIGFDTLVVLIFIGFDILVWLIPIGSCHVLLSLQCAYQLACLSFQRHVTTSSSV